MDRLTKRDGRIAVHVGGCTKRADPVFEKLAQYEDLEEAGRLVILPEGFDREKYIPRIARAFTRVFCPREFGLIDKQCDEWQPESVLLCYKCWETALEGGSNDNR